MENKDTSTEQSISNLNQTLDFTEDTIKYSKYSLDRKNIMKFDSSSEDRTNLKYIKDISKMLDKKIPTRKFEKISKYSYMNKLLKIF